MSTQIEVASEVVGAEPTNRELAPFDAIERDIATLKTKAMEAAKSDITTKEGLALTRKVKKACVAMGTTLTAAAKDRKEPHHEALATILNSERELKQILLDIKTPLVDRISNETARIEKVKTDKKEKVDAILARIDKLRDMPLNAVGKSSDEIMQGIEFLKSVDIKVGYEGFEAKTTETVQRSLEMLTDQHSLAITKEEVERQATHDRAELDALRKKAAMEEAATAKAQPPEIKAPTPPKLPTSRAIPKSIAHPRPTRTPLRVELVGQDGYELAMLVRDASATSDLQQMKSLALRIIARVEGTETEKEAA